MDLRPNRVLETAEEIKGFLKQVGLVLAGGLAIGAYPIYSAGGLPSLTAALIGCGISTANVVAGTVSIVWSFDKPQPVFLKVILGGMAGRMMAIFIVLVGVVKLSDLLVLPLVGSMFGFYIVFQVLELRFVVKRGQVQKESEV
jgi:hypothetical protein